MSYLLDQRVEYAIEQLWLNPKQGDGDKALALLKEAANEGNGDACFFLGRCYLGKYFVHERFGFEEDFDKGNEYFNKSILLGSAIGMFGVRRLSGFKPVGGSYIHAPYSSNKEIWDVVENLAKEGQVFCQYMVGNAYYFGDCIELLEIPESTIDGEMIRSFQMKAAELFQKSIDCGLTLAIPNLIDILTSGDYGLPIDEDRAKEIIKQGVNLQHPYSEYQYAKSLEGLDLNEAIRYYQLCAEHGGSEAYYILGKHYAPGGKLPQDIQKAISYFEKGIEKESNWEACANHLGKLYFYGADGLAPDYEKAFQLFVKVRPEDNECSDMMGHCYLKGLGTEVDYVAARKEFSVHTYRELSAIGLGEIYCYGLGTTQNISQGMKYLKQFPDNPRSKEIQSHFKRTLFGWKQL